MTGDSVNPSLTPKEIIKVTEETLERGRSKQQVLDDLSRGQQFHSREYLAQIISLVPDAELRQRYRVLNRALFGLLLFAAGLCLAEGILLFSRGLSRPGGTAFFGFFVILSFAPQVRQMRGSIYRPLGLLSLMITVGLASRLSTFSPWNLPVILSFGATSILAFYLGSSLFPHRGFMGTKKDPNGNWML
jgi:hypothetical protein